MFSFLYKKCIFVSYSNKTFENFGKSIYPICLNKCTWLKRFKLTLNALKFRTLSPVHKKMLIIRAGIPKMFVGIANREDPDQTASSNAV